MPEVEPAYSAGPLLLIAAVAVETLLGTIGFVLALVLSLFL